MASCVNFEQCSETEIDEYIGILGCLKNIVKKQDIKLSRENIKKYFSHKEKGSTILKLLENTKIYFVMRKSESVRRESSIPKEDNAWGESSIPKEDNAWGNNSQKIYNYNCKIGNVNAYGSLQERSSADTDSEKKTTSCEELKPKKEELIRPWVEKERNLNAEIFSLKVELQNESTSHEELKKKHEKLEMEYEKSLQISNDKEKNLITDNSNLKVQLEKESRVYEEFNKTKIEVEKNKDDLEKKYEELSKKHETLEKKYGQLRKKHEKWKTKYDEFIRTSKDKERNLSAEISRLETIREELEAASAVKEENSKETELLLTTELEEKKSTIERLIKESEEKSDENLQLKAQNINLANALNEINIPRAVTESRDDNHDDPLGHF